VTDDTERFPHTKIPRSIYIYIVFEDKYPEKTIVKLFTVRLDAEEFINTYQHQNVNSFRCARYFIEEHIAYSSYEVLIPKYDFKEVFKDIKNCGKK